MSKQRWKLNIPSPLLSLHDLLQESFTFILYKYPLRWNKFSPLNRLSDGSTSLLRTWKHQFTKFSLASWSKFVNPRCLGCVFCLEWNKLLENLSNIYKYLPIFTWHIPVTAIFCAHHKMKFPEIKWYRFYNKQWSMGKYNTTVLAANDYAWLLNNVMSLYYTHYLWAIICKKFLYTVQTVGYKTINDGLNTFVLWF
jgi:hypothetical protein